MMAEKVRVKDRLTGNILASSSEIVIDGWKAHPERFAFPKSKMAVTAESESDVTETTSAKTKSAKRPVASGDDSGDSTY